MNKQDAAKSITDSIMLRMRTEFEKVEPTSQAAAEQEELLNTAAIFGFVHDGLTIGPGFIFADFRNLPGCYELLPLIEFLDSKGWETYSSSDWPDIKNRDYQLRKGGVVFRLGAYFSSHNCRKVPVRSTTEYRLEYGAAENQTAATPAEPSTPAPHAPGDDEIPF